MWYVRDERVAGMLRRGLLDEVRAFYAVRGPPQRARNSIGAQHSAKGWQYFWSVKYLEYT